MFPPLPSRLRCECLCIIALGFGLQGLLAPTTARAQVQPLVSQEGQREPYNSEPETAGWCSPTEALAKLRLPAGFFATLFAAEPDVQNPIAASIDPMGRAWVAENYTYAERSQRFDLSLNDRVVVLADEDGDGTADRRTVFLDSIQMLTGIAVGQGGVWLMCPPQLLFVPDADGDLVPDSPPQVKLDGFHVARENYHNFANGLSWGPDGWLYGRCGASCPGELGLPGAGQQDRVPVRGGMWRFHPQRQVVEVLTHGTTNPWGHDWNLHGEQFFINTVNGHLWHAIPGAHFVRPHTIDANPYTYELIDMHADHWHFDTGKGWTQSRGGAANDFGGGHAHVGMMIYNEGRWPEEYQGRLMTVNMHGRRVNVEELAVEGSGYVAHHAPDFIFSDDIWFRGMELLPLPDGNMLVIDWCDTGECHDHTGVHRTSGRIFKIAYDGAIVSKEQSLAPETTMSPAELAQVSLDAWEWSSRRARELLRDRELRGENCQPAIEVWQQALEDVSGDSVRRLRALWGLYQLEAIEPARLLPFLASRDPHLRSWAVRLLSDSWPIDNSDGSRPARSIQEAESAESRQNITAELVRLAAGEAMASVRLTLASTLQRLPHAERLPLAAALMSHAEDADDHNLPLMVWYGLTPLGDERPRNLVELLDDCRWPTVQRLIGRRVADQVKSQPAVMDALFDQLVELPLKAQAATVLGVSQALAGRQRVAMPKSWPTVRSQLLRSPLIRSAEQSASSTGAETELAELLEQLDIAQLDVLFGDGRAMDDLKQLVIDKKQSLETRRSALQSLVAGRAPGLKDVCLRLLGERYLNLVAAEGLAREEGDDVGQELVKRYRSFAPLDRPRIISILVTRNNWARELLSAIQSGQIERQELTAYDARQVASLGDAGLLTQLSDVWGQVRETPADRRQTMERIRRELATEDPVDLVAGHKLFEQSCGSCHKLYGSGGKLGPDLTGAQRSDLNYLLDNIVDPSAVVTKEFRATMALLKDGRVLTGLATSSTDAVLVLATQIEEHRIPIEEIEEQRLSTSSTMPDGLLNNFSPQQLRDLFAYLRTTSAP